MLKHQLAEALQVALRMALTKEYRQIRHQAGEVWIPAIGSGTERSPGVMDDFVYG